MCATPKDNSGGGEPTLTGDVEVLVVFNITSSGAPFRLADFSLSPSDLAHVEGYSNNLFLDIYEASADIEYFQIASNKQITVTSVYSDKLGTITATEFFDLFGQTVSAASKNLRLYFENSLSSIYDITGDSFVFNVDGDATGTITFTIDV